MTAQKKDVYDPAVIRDFARLVGDQVHLDHLYLLTVADVRGTNPGLWTAWKARAFEDLYRQTERALRMNIEHPRGTGELLREREHAALAELRGRGLEEEGIRAIWSGFCRGLFLAFPRRRDRVAHDGAARRPFRGLPGRLARPYGRRKHRDTGPRSVRGAPFLHYLLGAGREGTEHPGCAHPALRGPAQSCAIPGRAARWRSAARRRPARSHLRFPA